MNVYVNVCELTLTIFGFIPVTSSFATFSLYLNSFTVISDSDLSGPFNQVLVKTTFLLVTSPPTALLYTFTIAVGLSLVNIGLLFSYVTV